MKIAIAGYGIEGASNYLYYAANPDNDLTIVDQRQPEREIPAGAKTIIGEHSFGQLQDFDLVIRTAGLSPYKIKTGGKIWSATNEFFSKCPAKIIGVTGTKGKGTTASLIASILESAGKKVWLLGNIGSPALDSLSQIQADDLVVYELSSFQLWDLERSPNVAVVLYIEQEHLDVHKDMTDYIGAKSNIARHQTAGDLLVYNQFNDYASEISRLSPARLIGYPDIITSHVKNDSFYYGEQKICSISALNIIGAHNLDNACAAIDAIWDITNEPEIIEKGLRGFKGLPHRLQFVREVNGVEYYDDSIATTPSSAIAALNSFSGPKVVVLGGSSKGSDYSDLGRELTKHDVKAILIGDEASTIAEACQRAGFYEYEMLDTPTAVKIVELAAKLSQPGGVVLLSPASASFGLFKNYIDRGNQFTAAVNALT